MRQRKLSEQSIGAVRQDNERFSAIVCRCPAFDQAQLFQPMDQFGCAVRLEDQAFRDVADRCLGIFRAPDGEKSLMLLGRQSYLIRPLFTERKKRPQDRSKLSQRSEEHTSELQSLLRISYAVFCLKKKKT